MSESRSNAQRARSSRLSDRAEIRDLIERYAGYADARRPDDLAELFTEDGVLVVRLDPNVEEPTVRQGRAAIAEAIRFLDRYRHTQHLIASSIIDVEGDAAHAESQCTAHHINGEGAQTSDWTVHLRYSDDFVRVDGRWLIARRELRTMWMTTSVVS